MAGIVSFLASWCAFWLVKPFWPPPCPKFASNSELLYPYGRTAKSGVWSIFRLTGVCNGLYASPENMDLTPLRQDFAVLLYILSKCLTL